MIDKAQDKAERERRVSKHKHALFFDPDGRTKLFTRRHDALRRALFLRHEIAELQLSLYDLTTDEAEEKSLSHLVGGIHEPVREIVVLLMTMVLRPAVDWDGPDAGVTYEEHVKGVEAWQEARRKYAAEQSGGADQSGEPA